MANAQTSWFREILSVILGHPIGQFLSNALKDLFQKAGEHVTEKEIKVIMTKIFGPGTEDERRFTLAMSFLDPNEQKRIWEMLGQLESHQSDYFRITVMQEKPEDIAKVLREVYAVMDDKAWQNAIQVMNYDLEHIQDKWTRVQNWIGANWRTHVWPALRAFGWWRAIGLVALVWFLDRTTPSQIGQAIATTAKAIWTQVTASGGGLGKGLGWLGTKFGAGLKATFSGLGKGISATAKGTAEASGWLASIVAWLVRNILAVTLGLLGLVAALGVLFLASPTFRQQVFTLGPSVLVCGVILTAITIAWVTHHHYHAGWVVTLLGMYWLILLGTLWPGFLANLATIGLPLFALLAAVLLILSGWMTTVRWWRRIAYALTTILLGVLLLPPVYRWVAGTSFGQISGRYFNAVGGQKFTQWVRAIVPREIDRGLTLGEVTEDASLYVQEAGKLKPKVLVETLEVKTKEPIIILWGVKIGEIEKVEEKTIEKRQVLKAGTKVKVWQARPNLVFDDGENDEPVLKVKIADESGEFITSKEELYVVARKVRLTSPLPAKADMRPTPWYHHLIYLLAMIVGMWMIMNLPPKEKLGRRITWVAMTVVMLPMAVYMLINMIDAKAAPIPTRTTTVTTTRIGQPVSGVIGPPEYVALVDKYLAQYPTVPRNLALAMIQVESSWDPRAVSPRGAQGLMQLMPDTARLLGVSDPFDPDQNIRGGIQYLAQQLADFSSTELALVAYHWGPENVRKHPGKTWEQILASSDEPRPGPLTIDYVRDVIALARGQAPGQPGVQMAVTPPPPPPPKEFEISFGLAEGTTYETVVVTCTTDSKVETAEMTKKRPYWGFKITPATRCVAQDEAGREIKLVDSKGQLLPTGFQPKPNLVAWVQ